MTSISFILPYYRLGRKLLDRAVDSILNARLACDYEIIVVDDGTPTARLRSGLTAREPSALRVAGEWRAQRRAQQRNRNGREGVCPIS